MKKAPMRRPVPPSVTVLADDQAIDLRLWARSYVQLLCTIEGIALIPSTLERAS